MRGTATIALGLIISVAGGVSARGGDWRTRAAWSDDLPAALRRAGERGRVVLAFFGKPG
ncbi:MAG: hypothetical protein M9894_20610 [Planctomycetes bacterium]|nr:hypothetical protein [Planctomycetota bacterium]